MSMYCMAGQVSRVLTICYIVEVLLPHNQVVEGARLREASISRALHSIGLCDITQLQHIYSRGGSVWTRVVKMGYTCWHMQGGGGGELCMLIWVLLGRLQTFWRR